MLSISQAASALGALGLVVIAGLLWWYSDIKEVNDKLHQDYLDVGDEVEAKQRKLGDLRNECEEFIERRERLKKKQKKRTQSAKTDALQVNALAKTVALLKDQMDTHRQLFNYLSFALAPNLVLIPAERNVLGTLDHRRVAVKSLVEEQGRVVITGEALLNDDVKMFSTRLKAAGYLSKVKIDQTTAQTDAAIQKPYVAFRISAALAHPGTSQLAGQEGAP